MDTPSPPQPVFPPDDDESFLDDVYARIVDLMEDAQQPDPSVLAAERPHLLPRIRRLVQVARAVNPLREAKPPILPGYEVLSCLGAGGMGEVFLCRQTKMGGRLVAVKVLSDVIATSRRGLDMLRDEALALARLRHPGVVDVYEFVVGLDDDGNSIDAFAMQWIQGCSLAEWFARIVATYPPEPGRGSGLQRSGSRIAIAAPMQPVSDRVPTAISSPSTASMPHSPKGDCPPQEFACRILASVARTVHAVHGAGLLHRDIKPSNILLREDGAPLVSDFGLALDMRADSDGQAVTGFSGTRAFASPEQRRGEPLDARSDIYALGMTLRHVLIDSPPIPADLAAIIATATALRPEDRYATAADFANDLERFLSQKPVRANPPRLLRRSAMFLRRNRRALLGTSLGALCTLLLAAAVVTAIFIAPHRAELHLARARLELLSPGHANVIWNTEWYRNPGGRFDLTSDARQRAAVAYRAALRWRPWGAWSDSVRGELAVVEGGRAPADDPHLSGLAAYLAGDSTGAITAWSRLAAREDPDAFIDGALGVLYLVREQHALAYPRLEHACTAFPKVGFLAAYHADAAAGCGDLDRAERLLNEAAHFDNQDTHRAAVRVRADLLLAHGKLEEAQDAILRATLQTKTITDTLNAAASPSEARIELLRIALESPIAASRLARIHAAAGEYDKAASAMGSALARGMGPPSAHAEFTSYVDRWWNSLSMPARRRAIQQAMDLDPGDPASLVFRLRHAAERDSVDGVASSGHNRPSSAPERSGGLWPAIVCDFVALGRVDSHSSLQRASRGEIARRLEVRNMARWKLIPAYSTTMKSWQLAAWLGPTPKTGADILARLHRAIGPRARPDAPAPIPPR